MSPLRSFLSLPCMKDFCSSLKNQTNIDYKKSPTHAAPGKDCILLCDSACAGVMELSEWVQLGLIHPMTCSPALKPHATASTTTVEWPVQQAENVCDNFLYSHFQKNINEQPWFLCFNHQSPVCENSGGTLNNKLGI